MEGFRPGIFYQFAGGEGGRKIEINLKIASRRKAQGVREGFNLKTNSARSSRGKRGNEDWFEKTGSKEQGGSGLGARCPEKGYPGDRERNAACCSEKKAINKGKTER